MRAVDRADAVSDHLTVGYARCSTDDQDLTAQRDALARFRVPSARVYVDHGRTGPNRDRPGLRQALAAVRSGDTLVVTKLDRLARSVPDARRAGSGRHHHPSPAHHLGTGILAVVERTDIEEPILRTTVVDRIGTTPMRWGGCPAGTDATTSTAANTSRPRQRSWLR